MQGTWVPSLVQEDSTCPGATKPVCCKLSTRTKSVLQSPGAATTEA